MKHIIIDTAREKAFECVDAGSVARLLGTTIPTVHSWFRFGHRYRVFDNFIIIKGVHKIPSLRGGNKKKKK